MAKAAKIYSIEAVSIMNTVLQDFGEDMQTALDTLELEVRRAVIWVEDDRRSYWKQEVQRGYNKVGEARANLERAQMFKVGGRTPAALEEKRAFEMAKRRLRLAEEKLEIVKRWSVLLRQAVDEYHANLSQLKNWLQSDLPNALGALARMTEALESYLGVKVQKSSATSFETAVAGSFARSAVAQPTEEKPAEEKPSAEQPAEEQPAEEKPSDEVVGSIHGSGKTEAGDGRPEQEASGNIRPVE